MLQPGTPLLVTLVLQHIRAKGARRAPFCFTTYEEFEAITRVLLDVVAQSWWTEPSIHGGRGGGRGSY